MPHKRPRPTVGGQYILIREFPAFFQGQTLHQTLSVCAHTPQGGMGKEAEGM